MKDIIVLIFITFSLVTAHVTKDSSKITPVYRKVASVGHLKSVSSEVIRIVGGNEAEPNSLPYQAGLRLISDGSWRFCGGSLITTRYVLTAAHCLNENNLLSVEVILGAHNIGQTESTQQRISSTTFKFHANYDGKTQQNDLGSVYLPTAAQLNQYVQLIALPSKANVSTSFEGSLAVASGWGYDSNSATGISNVLRYINASILSNDVCTKTFGSSYITEKIICSGGEGNRGACFGDSGGPLVVDGILVGITSFISSNGCGAGDPSAFSRVTSFLDWISNNTDVVIS